MSIGVGIFLITVGAILAFGVRDRSSAVDLSVVGVIIMLAGACGIWLSYSITNKRRRVETQAIDPAVEEEYRTIEETVHAEPVAEPAPVTRARLVDPAPVKPAGFAKPAPAQETAPAPETAPVPETAEPVETQPIERHIDLDPAASGLQVEVPERRVPVRPRTQPVKPAESLRSRLMNQFRTRR
ncbi:DUF6458 family protein [Kribbella sp. NPDC005582]|uniref:DUF6458 family protein n=1 Tax=Kribbella sp. NPDC005582 TaxID=3156893 RepID=UPI0033BE0EED